MTMNPRNAVLGGAAGWTAAEIIGWHPLGALLGIIVGGAAWYARGSKKGIR